MLSVRPTPGAARIALAALVAAICLSQATLAPARAERVVTAGAAAPAAAAGDCSPFGRGTGWTPFMGFVYQNLPAFEIRTGDVIAFDLAAANDADIGLEIAMAPTLTNGGTFGVVPTIPFTRVVSNTQTPENPRGNATMGDYELRFRAEAPYSFVGGGLIVRFSNPSATLAADATCDGLVAGGIAADASGLFYARYITDPDGTCPCPNTSQANTIGQLRLTLADLPPRPGAVAVLGAVGGSKSCKAPKRKGKAKRKGKRRPGCGKARR